MIDLRIHVDLFWIHHSKQTSKLVHGRLRNIKSKLQYQAIINSFCKRFVLSSPQAIGRKIKMTTEGDTGRLIPRQIVRLAHTISADNMAAIAEGYMGIDEVTIKHTERDTTNAEAFNRQIIKLWANKNPKNQAQVSQNYCTL